MRRPHLASFFNSIYFYTSCRHIMYSASEYIHALRKDRRQSCKSIREVSRGCAIRGRPEPEAMRCVCLQGSASCISKEDTLQTQRRVWKCFQQYNVVNFVVSSCVVTALVLHLADAKKSVDIAGVHLRSVVLSPCIRTVPTESENEQARNQSQLSAHAQQRATRLDAALERQRQRIRQSDANLDVLTTNQHCIPGNASQSNQITDVAYKMSIAIKVPVIPITLDSLELHKVRRAQMLPAIHFAPHTRTIPLEPLLSVPRGFLAASRKSMPLAKRVLSGGAVNIFPYGQCTWWANQRYRQLHGIFVPWRINANAFQWVARAVEFGWHVSGLPKVGSIMVLQPGVDGAYGSGHVGVVERVLQNGRVIVSSMNWGNRPGTVTQSTYVIRSGVSFISSY